jgi:hypothetical protein
MAPQNARLWAGMRNVPVTLDPESLNPILLPAVLGCSSLNIAFNKTRKLNSTHYIRAVFAFSCTCCKPLKFRL